MKKYILLIIALIIVPFSAVSEEKAPSVDLHKLIMQAQSEKKTEVSRSESVEWMDSIMETEYGYSKISQEPVDRLRTLYEDAAYLLRNGAPIAGGTLITIARSSQDFAESKAGEGMAYYCDAMLQPAEEDDYELLSFLKRTKAAGSVLDKISRSGVRMSARVMVTGEIYDDAIAVLAGQRALDGLKATPEELALIQQAREKGKP
ncbi:hypothetical protein [Aeromonas jandaei]|uniref:hypothetical protein n=1 Tax=Aeromonas jandaei TaxID=650 RepID=UPI003B9DFAF8